MKFVVKTSDKQAFLKWFLKEYQFNNRENRWLLEMLTKNPHILEQINFVKSIRNCPRAINISSACSNEIQFLYKKNKLITLDHHKAYHDLRLDYKNPIYLRVNYNEQEKCPKYGFISIDNPFCESIVHYETYKNIAELLLEEISYDKNIAALETKINEAIDTKNEKDFMHYANVLKKYQNQDVRK